MPKMGFLSTFFQANVGREISDLGHQIARRCCPAVWSRVHPKAVSMSPSEARGYIRAHASLIVEAELAATIVSRRKLARRQVAILNLAREALVETLVGEVVRVQKTTVPRRFAA
jgi:hypothetical protein